LQLAAVVEVVHLDKAHQVVQTEKVLQASLEVLEDNQVHQDHILVQVLESVAPL
jgi:hypothetical protein